MRSPCRVGTRKSLLARTQAQWIADQLIRDGLPCVLVEVLSDGDRDKTNPLYSIESQAPGLFCKKLEEALLDNRIDIAVHSLKDLPTQQPDALFVAAIPRREAAGDCLILHPSSHDQPAKWGLGASTRVGTSSLRREAQLLEARSDLRVEPIRGNVPSRIAQVREGKLGGAVLATAGLRRLGLRLDGLVFIDLCVDRFISAPGQGALAVEVRRDAPNGLLARLEKLNDPQTQLDVRIERRILRDLEGGCTLPLGVHCKAVDGQRQVSAFLALAEKGTGRRIWSSFHRFDISSNDEETLVRQTVLYFRRQMKG